MGKWQGLRFGHDMARWEVVRLRWRAYSSHRNHALGRRNLYPCPILECYLRGNSCSGPALACWTRGGKRYRRRRPKIVHCLVQHHFLADYRIPLFDCVFHLMVLEGSFVVPLSAQPLAWCFETGTPEGVVDRPEVAPATVLSGMGLYHTPMPQGGQPCVT